MKANGKEVKDSIRCAYCGLVATFNHMSSSYRNDNKITVIYRCPYNHTSFDEISSKE